MSENGLVFAPLGGLGEIGMNMALYGFGKGRNRKWLMVDCGVAFAGDDLPGIDLILPDIAFIDKIRPHLVGLVITHAHEDHYGALADLGPRLGCKIYMSPFAAHLAEVRRLSEPGAPRLPIEIIPQAGFLSLGPFEVETIPVAHSIPESMALAIRTPAGLIVHTGDWKLDETPVLGLPTDEARLRQLGDEGVLALISDSTNITRSGRSPSERDVEKNLREIILNAKGRVAVTTFASNLARIRSVAEAAREAGREVVLVGRAMDRVVHVASELDMLAGLPAFKGPDRFKTLARDKCVLLLTGSQGEQRAALARVAEGEHPDISLSAGDMVIFSSRTIPGNEKAVGRIVNNLAKADIDMLTDRDALVHVSGHPRRDEMTDLYRWLRPKIAIPAHGEALHLSMHCAFARQMGVEQVLRVFNGDLVELAPGDARVIDKVPHGRLYKDGTLLVGENSPSLAERNKLASAGVVSVAMALDARGGRGGEVLVETIGLPAYDDEGETLVAHIEDIVDETLQTLPRGKKRDPQAINQALTRAIKSGLQVIWGKKPAVIVQIVEI